MRIDKNREIASVWGRDEGDAHWRFRAVGRRLEILDGQTDGYPVGTGQWVHVALLRSAEICTQVCDLANDRREGHGYDIWGCGRVTTVGAAWGWARGRQEELIAD